MTDAEAMLNDCNKRYAKLRESERGFIDRLTRIGSLDDILPEVYERLEAIWERIT